MKHNPALVVHIIYALGTGGLENGLVNIINRMPADRYKHVIVCLTHATDFADRITAPDVRVIELNKKDGHDLSVYWRLQKALWTLKPDIVHTRNLAALEMQALTLLLPGVKRVHGEHGRDIYDLDGKNRRYNRLRKLMSLMVHRYITVSKDLECWLHSTVGISENKIIQIYNGVDSSKFYPTSLDTQGKRPSNEEYFVIGTVGRIAKVKDQESIICALSEILQRYPILRGKLRLVIVGDGPLYKDLEERIVELGLEDNVALLGDRKDIPELLKTMDMYVLPSLNEGISNSILEAMATGLPVIATNVGGNTELVDMDTGILVPVKDTKALADAIVSLVNEPDKMRSMGLAGYNKIQRHFFWDKTVKNYLNVYDNLLE